MHTLLWIALVLIIIWLVGLTVFKLAGFIIHLLLIIGVVLLLWWIIRRVA